MPIAEISQGVAGWLISKLEFLAPLINSDLAAKVLGGTGGAAPAFGTMMGTIPATATPYLTCAYKSDMPVWTAQGIKERQVTFHIYALLPMSGACTPMNYEMARQVSSDWVLDWFDTDANALTPKINGGSLGVFVAEVAERGPLVDIWPFRMEDGQTIVRGWQMPYVVKVSLKTR